MALAVLQRFHPAAVGAVVELQSDHVGLVGLAPEIDAHERHALITPVEEANDQPVDRVRHERGQAPELPHGPVQQQEDEEQDEEVM